MNGDLISRSALLEENMYGNTAPIAHRTYAERLIQNAPAVDAVPVVRCKDCMFAGNELTCPMLSLVDHTEPDEYCSFGRKADENE